MSNKQSKEFWNSISREDFNSHFSSSLNGSLGLHPEVLNLPVALLSVPTFLRALKLEAVFRKQAAMVANTCMCCYFFKCYCCFTCRCLPLFYSLITICFLNSWYLYACVEVSVYIGFLYICFLYTIYCSIYYVRGFLKMMLSEAFWYAMI